MHQCPMVIGELLHLQAQQPSGQITEEISNTIDFLQKVEQGMSAKFIGD